MLKIENFKDAFYNAEEKFGYLAYYYPFNKFSNDYSFWKHETYSSNILDFKEGKEEDIKFFVKSFCSLIEYVLSLLQKTDAFLVPVPSSIAWNDPNFKTTPRQKNDNRNMCQPPKYGQN